ncbi:MAG: hypothetical protein GY797_39665 [Deltaproteobacteria bacterium]|nr:hypothetical protein [Deltaproteobacteria bacterium]
MGMQKEKHSVKIEQFSEQIKAMKEKLEEAGIESAEIGFDSKGILGISSPILKSIRIGKGPLGPIEGVAQADPGNISQVAASQLDISNTYYESVLFQAQQSFRWAIIGAGVGIIFFVVAIGFVLYNQPTPVSTISVVTGALVEVLSGINFWLYRQTARQLEVFHSRLEQTQRFILANSVCENLEGETKQAARAELVHTIATSKTSTRIKEKNTKKPTDSKNGNG